MFVINVMPEWSYPNQKHPSCKRPRPGNGCDEKDVKSKGGGQICAGMLLITLKFLIMITAPGGHYYQKL